MGFSLTGLSWRWVVQRAYGQAGAGQAAVEWCAVALKSLIA